MIALPPCALLNSLSSNREIIAKAITLLAEKGVEEASSSLVVAIHIRHVRHVWHVPLVVMLVCDQF